MTEMRPPAMTGRGRDFRPRPGHLLFGSWPAHQPVPDGWQRHDGDDSPAVRRVATGEQAATAVTLIGYTESLDCGVANVHTTRTCSTDVPEDPSWPR